MTPRLIQPDILDNTKATCYQRCPRQYYWRHMRHLVSGGYNIDLSFGQTWHKALEYIYLDKPEADILAQFTDIYRPLFELNWPDSKKKTPDLGLKLLKDYIKRFNKDRQWTILEVEVALQVELASDLIACGRADLLIRERGEIYIVEHKTTSNINWFTHKPNNQITGYITMAKILGHNIAGCIPNIVPCLKKYLKEPTEFYRPKTYRSEEDCNEWIDMFRLTKTHIEQSIATGWFPLHTGECWRCPYKNLCNTDSKYLENVVKTDFEVNEWKPWEAED